MNNPALRECIFVLSKTTVYEICCGCFMGIPSRLDGRGRRTYRTHAKEATMMEDPERIEMFMKWVRGELGDREKYPPNSMPKPVRRFEDVPSVIENEADKTDFANMLVELTSKETSKP